MESDRFFGFVRLLKLNITLLFYGDQHFYFNRTHKIHHICALCNKRWRIIVWSLHTPWGNSGILVLATWWCGCGHDVDRHQALQPLPLARGQLGADTRPLAWVLLEYTHLQYSIRIIVPCWRWMTTGLGSYLLLLVLKLRQRLRLLKNYKNKPEINYSTDVKCLRMQLSWFILKYIHPYRWAFVGYFFCLKLPNKQITTQ